MFEFLREDQTGSLKFIVLLIILAMVSVYIGFQAGNAFFARRHGAEEETPAEEEIISEDELPEEATEGEDTMAGEDMDREDLAELEDDLEEPEQDAAGEDIQPAETEAVLEEEAAEEETEMEIDREADYLIQIGAFGQEENAEAMVAELREQNFPAFISSEEPFRVQVVGGESRSEAEEIADQLTEAGYETLVHSQ